MIKWLMFGGMFLLAGWGLADKMLCAFGLVLIFIGLFK